MIAQSRLEANSLYDYRSYGMKHTKKKICERRQDSGGLAEILQLMNISRGELMKCFSGKEISFWVFGHFWGMICNDPNETLGWPLPVKHFGEAPFSWVKLPPHTALLLSLPSPTHPSCPFHLPIPIPSHTLLPPTSCINLHPSGSPDCYPQVPIFPSNQPFDAHFFISQRRDWPFNGLHIFSVILFVSIFCFVGRVTHRIVPIMGEGEFTSATFFFDGLFYCFDLWDTSWFMKDRLGFVKTSWFIMGGFHVG